MQALGGYWEGLGGILSENCEHWPKMAFDSLLAFTGAV